MYFARLASRQIPVVSCSSESLTWFLLRKPCDMTAVKNMKSIVL